MHIMSHFSSNFDLFDTSTMMLHHYHDDDNDDDEDEDDEGDTNRYYLRLTPIEYYVVSHDSDPATRVHMLTDSIPLCKRLGIDDASMERLDIVLIPAFRSYILQSSDIEPYYQPHFFILVGCFAKNKWILPPSSHTYSYPKLEDDSLQLHMNDGEEKNKPVVVFDIY
ncbi:hypothetical protein BCR42DRAFT_428383 [Absidia repens]|uniref:Uncharacterized protein n=1 Tax=Absidia repens TaxID=90262 RepID=A0A1X2HY72_9FUNG|nr:hypothetical protein BCR42DRAFT_428383 [Absidia repens]